MAFWIFMLVMVLLTPAVMVFFGRGFMKKAPDDIQVTFGYRSEMSMKNRDTWRFAHQYCGKLWYVCGLLLIPLSVAPMAAVIHGDAGRIGTAGGLVVAVQIVLLASSAALTERKLKRTFDSSGRRR